MSQRSKLSRTSGAAKKVETQTSIQSFFAAKDVANTTGKNVKNGVDSDIEIAEQETESSSDDDFSFMGWKPITTKAATIKKQISRRPR